MGLDKVLDEENSFGKWWVKKEGDIRQNRQTASYKKDVFDLCDLETTAREAYQAAQSQWQAIEFAPKDGTVIDLWVGGERSPACSYRKNKGWCFRLYSTDGTGYGWHKIKGEPSHFMLIPQSPEE